jgi:hypothetical protein
MNDKVREALQHPDTLGAGAEKRKHLSAADNAAALTDEFKRGTLRSGSGAYVTNPAQLRGIIRSTNKGRL